MCIQWMLIKSSNVSSKCWWSSPTGLSSSTALFSEREKAPFMCSPTHPFMFSPMHPPTHSFIHSLFHHACMHALNHIIHLIASSSPSSLFITSMLWSSSIKIQKPHLYWPNKFPKSPCSSIISYAQGRVIFLKFERISHCISKKIVTENLWRQSHCEHPATPTIL